MEGPKEGQPAHTVQRGSPEQQRAGPVTGPGVMGRWMRPGQVTVCQVEACAKRTRKIGLTLLHFEDHGKALSPYPKSKGKSLK